MKRFIKKVEWDFNSNDFFWLWGIMVFFIFLTWLITNLNSRLGFIAGISLCFIVQIAIRMDTKKRKVFYEEDSANSQKVKE